jgi:hypothetical protein
MPVKVETLATNAIPNQNVTSNLVSAEFFENKYQTKGQGTASCV